MDDFELIFTMLGERSTAEIHKTENSKGIPKLKQDADRGGRIADCQRTIGKRDWAIRCFPEKLFAEEKIRWRVCQPESAYLRSRMICGGII